jgi:thioredoxin 1
MICYHIQMLTLTDYYADWCGPCRIMEPIFEDLAKEYQGKVEFKRLDVEADQEQAAKFGVQSIPTFILTNSEGGQEVDRKIGAMPKEIVKKWLDSHVK